MYPMASRAQTGLKRGKRGLAHNHHHTTAIPSPHITYYIKTGLGESTRGNTRCCIGGFPPVPWYVVIWSQIWGQNHPKLVKKWPPSPSKFNLEVYWLEEGRDLGLDRDEDDEGWGMDNIATPHPQTRPRHPNTIPTPSPPQTPTPIPTINVITHGTLYCHVIYFFGNWLLHEW